MYRINHKVPIPDRAKYPFKKMEIGDSFFVTGISEDLQKIQRRLLVASHEYKPKVFSTRIIRKIGGVRCWRTK